MKQCRGRLRCVFLEIPLPAQGGMGRRRLEGQEEQRGSCWRKAGQRWHSDPGQGLDRFAVTGERKSWSQGTLKKVMASGVKDQTRP